MSNSTEVNPTTANVVGDEAATRVSFKKKQGMSESQISAMMATLEETSPLIRASLSTLAKETHRKRAGKTAASSFSLVGSQPPRDGVAPKRTVVAKRPPVLPPMGEEDSSVEGEGQRGGAEQRLATHGSGGTGLPSRSPRPDADISSVASLLRTSSSAPATSGPPSGRSAALHSNGNQSPYSFRVGAAAEEGGVRDPRQRSVEPLPPAPAYTHHSPHAFLPLERAAAGFGALGSPQPEQPPAPAHSEKEAVCSTVRGGGRGVPEPRMTSLRTNLKMNAVMQQFALPTQHQTTEGDGALPAPHQGDEKKKKSGASSTATEGTSSSSPLHPRGAAARGSSAEQRAASHAAGRIRDRDEAEAEAGVEDDMDPSESAKSARRPAYPSASSAILALLQQEEWESSNQRGEEEVGEPASSALQTKTVKLTRRALNTFLEREGRQEENSGEAAPSATRPSRAGGGFTTTYSATGGPKEPTQGVYTRRAGGGGYGGVTVHDVLKNDREKKEQRRADGVVVSPSEDASIRSAAKSDASSLSSRRGGRSPAEKHPNSTSMSLDLRFGSLLDEASESNIYACLEYLTRPHTSWKGAMRMQQMRQITIDRHESAVLERAWKFHPRSGSVNDIESVGGSSAGGMSTASAPAGFPSQGVNGQKVMGHLRRQGRFAAASGGTRSHWETESAATTDLGGMMVRGMCSATLNSLGPGARSFNTTSTGEGAGGGAPSTAVPDSTAARGGGTALSPPSRRDSSASSTTEGWHPPPPTHQGFQQKRKAATETLSANVRAMVAHMEHLARDRQSGSSRVSEGGWVDDMETPLAVGIGANGFIGEDVSRSPTADPRTSSSSRRSQTGAPSHRHRSSSRPKDRRRKASGGAAGHSTGPGSSPSRPPPAEALHTSDLLRSSALHLGGGGDPAAVLLHTKSPARPPPASNAPPHTGVPPSRRTKPPAPPPSSSSSLLSSGPVKGSAKSVRRPKVPSSSTRTDGVLGDAEELSLLVGGTKMSMGHEKRK